MSSPARQVRVRPAVKPRTRTSPSPKRPSKRSPSPQKRSKERGSGAFYVFATVLLIAMIFGLAALNAVLAQGAFKVQDLSNQQITLTQQNGELRREIDDLTSPARLTGVAAKDGLIFPDTNAIQVVHAGNTSGTAASSGHRHQTGTANSPANSASRPDGTATPTGLPGGPE